MEFVYNVPKYLDLASADQLDGGDFDSFFVATEYRGYSPQTMSSSTEEFSLPKDAAAEEAAPSEGTDNSLGSIGEIMKNLDLKTHKKSRKHGILENQENKAPRDKKGARRRSRSFAMGCPLGETFRNRANREKYMSLAEAIEHFHKDTPVRFRLKPSKASNENKGSGSWKGQCTLPKSPVLKSQLRIRPINYLPHEVQQELQMQEMKRHKFKAQPLNTVMLKQLKPLKAVQPKPVTIPVPFALTEVKHTRKEPEEEYVQFKANPIPKSVHLAPNSSLGDRSNASDTSQSGMGSRPAPGSSVYERSLLMQQKKQEKILQIYEEERKAREFHANPIPKSVKNAPLQRSTDSSLAMHTTKPEPFSLHTEQRMVEHEKKRLEELAKQRMAEMQAMNFKAQPATVLHKEPFVPKKAEHPTLEVPEIVLNTEVRAKKREEFDQLLKEKDMLVEQYKANKLEQQRLEEEQERARLRKEATFKAQPFRPTSPLIVNPSDKPLTVPESPCIGKKRIANKKH